jgi:hypothetical protein
LITDCWQQVRCCQQSVIMYHRWGVSHPTGSSSMKEYNEQHEGEQ